jgi:phosphatidate cytidylyltransferase
MPIHFPSQPHIFLIYATLLLVILTAAGGVLAFMTLGLHRNVRPIWATYASWCVLGPLVFGTIYLGRIPTDCLFTLFAVLGFKEFARATGLYRDWWMTGAGYLAIVATGLTALIHNPNDGSPGWYGLYMALPVYAIALFILMPILRNHTQGQLQAVALTILGYVYIGWMFLHLAFLADSPNFKGYVLFILIAVELNDVAAFVFGHLLGRHGKHQLRSRISPNKTWEGALGALAISMLLPWLLHFSFPYFGAAQLILTGLIVGIGGQLGDLSISVIKRDLGIKDMGALIPGHGGVLDRIDSLMYSAPLFLHMVHFYYKHW